MKKLTIALVSMLLFLVGCSSSKFSAVEGTVAPDQIVTIAGVSDETAQVTFTKVNDKVAPNASEALAPAGSVSIEAAYVRGADKFTKTLSFEGQGGQTYQVGFRNDDVEYKMGSKDTKHKVVLWVKDASGAFVAGSDSKNDMEFAVQ